MKKTIVFLFIFVFIVSLAGAAEKPKAATIDFKETGTQIENIGQIAANKVNDFLVQLGTVTVVDRANLETILDEQNIAITGIVEASAQSLVGRIKGVDYLVLGEVSQANVTRKQDTKTWKEKKSDGSYQTRSKKIWVWQAQTTVQIRIVDVVSGQVMYSGTRTGSAKDEEDYIAPKQENATVALVKAIQGIEDSVERVEPNKERPDLAFNAAQTAVDGFKIDLYNVFRPSGYIIAIDPADPKGKKFVVTIDLGESFGVRKGEQYEVVQQSAPVRHPVTGEQIPGAETVIYKLKIKEVGAHMSKAEIKKKDEPLLKVGLTVKARKKTGALFTY